MNAANRIVPRIAVTDNQSAMLPAIRAERARRALYASCDRAPFGWEARLPTPSFHAGQAVLRGSR